MAHVCEPPALTAVNDPASPLGPETSTRLPARPIVAVGTRHLPGSVAAPALEPGVPYGTGVVVAGADDARHPRGCAAGGGGRDPHDRSDLGYEEGEDRNVRWRSSKHGSQPAR